MPRRLALPASLALRIALASALFGLALAAVGMLVGYWALAAQLQARAEGELRSRRGLVLQLLAEMPGVGAVRAGEQRFRDVLAGHEDLHLALVEARTGAVLATFSRLGAASVAALDAQPAQPPPVRWRADEATTLDGMRETARIADGTPVRIYLSLDRRHDMHLLSGFLRATVLALPLMLAAVALGAWLIARTGLGPLRQFRRMAASIGTESLDRRLSEAGLPEELGDLAREFNAMLERIDRGYRRLQEFSADLAHELRTPIAILLGRSQVALSQQRTAPELREVLEGDIEQLERLSRLIGDMLFIAQAEHGQAVLQLEPVELQAEARHVAEYLSLVAEEKGVEVRVRGEAAVRADRLLVQRAITNLVSNAVRHARAGSKVEIDIVAGQREASLTVANRGEPIAGAHLERIFDRFYRVDASRARHSGGAGLGLAIVRSIMQAHGGSVSASSDAGSGTTTFRLAFPVAAG